MDFFCFAATVSNEGKGSIHKSITGRGNSICIGRGSILFKPEIHIRGYNNKLTIGRNCYIGPDCSFWMEGNNCKIIIGDGTTFTRLVHVNAQENGLAIMIGSDCMFSNNIIVRTSDSHPIFDNMDGKRLNPAKSIFIGNHVWIAPNSKIMKGAIIGDDCIIGSDTTVSSKIISPNSLVVGRPSKVIRSNIRWTRDDVILGK